MVAHDCPDSLPFYTGRDVLLFFGENVPALCHMVWCDVSHTDIKEHGYMTQGKKPMEIRIQIATTKQKRGTTGQPWRDSL